MGLLNKLKNVLFEEEEIEISEKEVVEEPKAKEPLKRKDSVKMTFDSEDDDILSDRELFKAEPTFNFPTFDEKEFESVKTEEVSPKFEQSTTRSKSTSILDVERGRRNVPKEKKRERERTYDYKELRQKRESDGTYKKFTPSPVISPVYGVLDKNYKKEDILVKVEEKKTIDVDSVRKKAFGTLEDDIEKTLSTPVKTFYEEEKSNEKSLNELLEDTMEEVIPVTDSKDLEINNTKLDFSSFNIEEPINDEEEDSLEILDRPKKKPIEEKLQDDTLENDLFDLIDSMYENREDGEEE